MPWLRARGLRWSPWLRGWFVWGRYGTFMQYVLLMSTSRQFGDAVEHAHLAMSAEHARMGTEVLVRHSDGLRYRAKIISVDGAW